MFGAAAPAYTKAFLVDDRRGFVGSFNLDPRSAYLNTEMGVLFDDPLLGAQLRGGTCAWRIPGTAGGWRWTTVAGCAGWSANHHHWAEEEPGATARKRWLSRVISWLPLESQL